MKQRPLEIGILNLMPTKEATEAHLRALLQQEGENKVNLTLLYPASHYQNKPVPRELLESYTTFAEVKEKEFDGFIITGAPLEQLAFEEIDYWTELCHVLACLKTKQIPLLAICWGAQAALYYYYQIEKEELAAKTVGVFQHQVKETTHPLMKNFEPTFLAPHSRYTTVKEEQVIQAGLVNVASSAEAGLYLLSNQSQRETYVFGHGEYGRETLREEYLRDSQIRTDPPFPKNYFPEDNPANEPEHTWKQAGLQLFENWLALISSELLPTIKKNCELV